MIVKKFKLTPEEQKALDKSSKEELELYLRDLNSLTPEQRKDYEQYKKEVLEYYVKCCPTKKEKRLIYVEKDPFSLGAIMQHFKSYLEDGQKWIGGPLECLDLLFYDED